MADAFPIGGSIDPATFPFLLANLHQQGATGSLKVDGPGYQKALYFRGGRILFGSSNDPHDQLGAILIESGRLSAAQLDEAAAKVGPGNPLAKVLADGGLVNQRDLADAARAKVERILCDLVVMPAGTFEFEDDVLPKGAIDLRLLTPRLFVAALRRVPQRDFLERHLGGLDVVLRPLGESAQRLAEIFADVAGLPDVLDGRRSLREAATLARLEPFEAAKLACALLFLGLIEKVQDAPPTFETIESEADELDLAATTRITFDFAPGSARQPEPAQPADDAEPPFFVPSTAPAAPAPPAAPAFQVDLSSFSPAAEPEPTLRLPAAEVVAPTVSVPPPAPLPPLPPPAPEPVAEPTLVLRPPPAPARSPGLPLVPPPPRAPRANRPAPPRAEESEPTLDPPTLAPRPSREDLEALDSLLNARSLESPLAGSTVAEAPVQGAPRRLPPWEPSFGRGAAARGRQAAGRGRGGGGRARLALLALAAVVLGVGAAWLWLGRSRPDVTRAGVGVVKPHPLPGATAVPATTYPSPSAVGTAAPLVLPPPAGEADDEEEAPAKRAPESARASAAPASVKPASPTPVPAQARASTAPPVTTAATATPAPSRSAPPPPARAASADDARALLRRGDLAAAGRGFVGTLKAAPRDSYSIQLLLACAPETVGKAVASADAPELFIVPIHYRGRDCWRVCWGLYDGRARAESARRSVPAYFRAGGAAPKVVAAAELLP